MRARQWYALPVREQTQVLAMRLTAAFALQINLILLFGAVCFSLALASLTPVAIGAVGELSWLAAAVMLEPVQRWVAEQALPEAERHTYDALSHELRDRARRVRDSVQLIGNIAKKHGSSDAALLDTRVDEVLRAFLRLAHASQLLSSSLARTPADALQVEVQRLTDALVGEKELVVKLSVKQALVVAQRRVRERERIAQALRATDLQMRTFEGSLADLRSTLASKSPVDTLAAKTAALTVQLATGAAVERDAGALLTEPTVSTRPPAPSLSDA